MAGSASTSHASSRKCVCVCVWDSSKTCWMHVAKRKDHLRAPRCQCPNSATQRYAACITGGSACVFALLTLVTVATQILVVDNVLLLDVGILLLAAAFGGMAAALSGLPASLGYVCDLPQQQRSSSSSSSWC